MRDPRLVFKAQLAAAALERAWQRWRVVHGLMADPMPTISSYVGYSLEEPWGQPRVVFGLSADDAEQLAALLDKHDCVGPVHATIAAEQGGREARPSAADSAGWPSVPSQAPPLAAEHSVNASRGGVQAPRPRFVPTEDPADEQDGPVFREVVAAVQRAAAERGAASSGAIRDRAAEVAGGLGVGVGQGAARPGFASVDVSDLAHSEDPVGGGAQAGTGELLPDLAESASAASHHDPSDRHASRHQDDGDDGDSGAEVGEVGTAESADGSSRAGLTPGADAVVGVEPAHQTEPVPEAAVTVTAEIEPDTETASGAETAPGRESSPGGE